MLRHFTATHGGQLTVCPLCRSSFLSAEEMAGHACRIAGDIILKCRFCDFQAEGRNKKQRIDSHIKVVHSLKCPKCGSVFLTEEQARLHYLSAHPKHRFHQCKDCKFRCRSTRSLLRHRLASHSKTHTCLWTGCAFIGHTTDEVERHSEENHLDSGGFEIVETAFSRTCITYARSFEAYEITSVTQLFSETSEAIEKILLHTANVKKQFKYALVIYCRLVKREPSTGELITTEMFPSRSKQHEVTVEALLNREVIRGQLEECLNTAISFVEDHFEGEGSGWILEYIPRINVEVARCRPMAGSAGEIDLTQIVGNEFLKEFSTRSDDRCFVRAVATHFTNNEPEAEEFVKDCISLEGLTFPVSISHIDKFEKRNPFLRVNVLFSNGKRLYTVRAKPQQEGVESVNLLTVSYTHLTLPTICSV